MDQYDLTLDGQTVVVDTGVTKQGPPRGTHDFLTPTEGPELHRKGLTCRRERPATPAFEPEWLDRSLNRYMA